MLTDPVLILLAELFSKAGVYSGFVALSVLIVNVIVNAFSGKGLRIE